MAEPFFSVIIPAHNCAEYMQRGLDSVKSQSFTDYELIIVCDACEDNTEEIAREYTDKVYTVNYHWPGPTRSTGLDHATGKWILWMDDDDWYLPGAFQQIADCITQNPQADIIAYGFTWDGVGTTLQSPKRLLVAVWTKAWRRDFIGDVRFPDHFCAEDLEFGRILHPKAKFAYLPQVLYFYNFLRKDSFSDKLRHDSWEQPLNNDLKQYQAWLQKNYMDFKGED